MNWPILSVLVWLPILGGIAVMALGEGRARFGKQLALGTSIVTFVLSLGLWTGFDFDSAAMQFGESVSWIERFDAFYALGVDGISMPLVLLTTFLTPFVVVAGWEVIETRSTQYFAAFLILEGLMIGTFAATDALLFYVFWEAMLVPMFIIIGVWGGARRVYATVKFFLYTFLGSVFMLVALIYMYLQAGDYAIASFHDLRLGMNEQILIFLAFLLAFAVKVPMFPVHTWLPDAHVEAPTGGSVILAAILLKMGGYGFIRFSLAVTPDASRELAWLMIALSLIAVVYIGFVALVQTDMKKLIAYSSISHMGFVTLGFFVFNAYGVEGGLVQMISHGFVSAALFLCVGVLYDRMHTRMIADYGGVVNSMPKFAALMMLFAMANAGLPATSGFVGEFMVIMGAMQANFWLALVAATTLIWGAAYTLWMYKRVIFGAVANERVAALQDLNRRELLVLGLLAAAVLFMGVYPLPFTEVMHASVNELLRHVAVSKL